MKSPSSGCAKKTIIHVVSSLAGVGLLILIATRSGISQFQLNLSSISPIVFVPLVFVYSISWLLRGFRFKRILLLFGVKSSLFKSLGIELVADLANQVIPAKLGDSVKIVYMNKTGMLKYASGTFAAFLVRAMDLSAVIILALFSAVFVSGTVATGYQSYILAMTIMIFLLFLTGWLFVFQPLIFQKILIGPLRKIRPSVSLLADQMKQKPKQLLFILAESILVWIFDILTLYIFLFVFEVRLSFSETAFVMLLSTVTKILPLTPNGIGVYEGMMVVLLTKFGIIESTAFTIAVLDHGFMNLYSILLSLIAIYSLGLGFKEVSQLADPHKESILEHYDN